MKPIDVLRFAWTSLRGYPARTLLMTVAMAIGVASVVIFTALGEGARRYVVDQFSALGTHASRCVWNFGNNQPNTFRNFGKDAQYGAPNLARYGGTLISAVHPRASATSFGDIRRITGRMSGISAAAAAA